MSGVDGRGPEPLTEQRERYVRLIADGVSNSEACRLVGVNRKTGTREDLVLHLQHRLRRRSSTSSLRSSLLVPLCSRCRRHRPRPIGAGTTR